MNTHIFLFFPLTVARINPFIDAFPLHTEPPSRGRCLPSPTAPLLTLPALVPDSREQVPTNFLAHRSSLCFIPIVGRDPLGSPSDHL